MTETKDCTATCPKCDGIIELEAAAVGDHVDCSNFPCFWEGDIESIDEGGNAWFAFEDPDDQEDE